ncbi:outer membrane beta-barrel protein [Chitinophaga sp. GCM10012297]|uniref:Porin family protein n=1 Tax=Chitinophaga chungangae TaxID=2821488 RepID=A0ABS3YER2_9BACT|nr:outer membrane beta-barrel protein [Chitinophaga chungangae]MBO9153170.1 porin family protein [Chitinophaga chungangae]
MKKMIIVAALGLFGIQFANAQVKKGDVLVGGNVGIATSSEKVDGTDGKTTSTTFNISPKAGYALSDKWMVGVFVGTDFTNSKDKTVEPNTELKSTVIAPGIFVRNYHMLGEKVALFGEANVAYGFGTVKANDTKTASVNSIDANIVPGISYFVNKRFVLEGVFGGINYSNVKSTNEINNVETTNSSFNFDFTKKFRVGVSFLF